MSKSKKGKILLSSEDFYRVLITDTQPYHMPIIFNNYGFYNAIDKSRKSIDFYKYFIEDLGDPNLEEIFSNCQYTIPFEYKISKNIHSFRSLKLIHPFHQLKFVDFYRKFYSIILYNCNRSEFSLRYPSKVNSTVFRLKNDDIYQKLMNENDLYECQSNEQKVDIENNNQEFASSFFTYKKFEFNYKFYDSVDFLRLEKKFVYLTMLDVAHCFDSIYTHSISWAIKGKQYTKNNLNKPKEDHSFEGMFDKLMCSVNYNETNGIVVGAEFSRIFAELIFQRIDFEIQKELEESYKIKNNEHYAIRRYVDDYCVFFKESGDENKILEVIADKLKYYNLSLNMAKTKHFKRPFITQRSRNITEVRRFLLSKMSEIIYLKTNENSKCYFLDGNKLKNPQQRANEFIREIKSYWNIDDDSNSGFSGYIIKAFLSQTLKFISYSDIFLNNEKGNCNSVINFLLFIFEVSLYCFIIDPNVSNSIEFSKIVILIDRFIGNNKSLYDYKEQFRYNARNSLLELLDNELSNQKITLIERLNILLTYCEISEIELDGDRIGKYLFGVNNNMSIDVEKCNYFSLIVALFIFKDKDCYKNLKYKVIKKIKEKISKNPIKTHSETFHLYLDCMSCPYLDEKDKIDITKIFLPNKNHNYNPKKIVTRLQEYNWFVDWKNIDFLRYLRKKQLRNAY